MPNTVITSRQHPLCKLVRALHDARVRRRHKLFVVEGANAVASALRMRWPLQRVLVAPEDAADWEALLDGVQVQVQLVDDDILGYLSEAQTSPGVIALAALPAPPASDWDVQDMLLVLDGISDPGNAGTLLRAADATGAGGSIFSSNSVDAFGPKIVRASAGSLFHLPPLQLEDREPESLINELGARGIPIIAAEAHDGTNCFEFRWPRRCALVLGHETRGVSEEFEGAATARVSIPMYGRAESLNVAMAGTILLYAWRQQF